MSNSEITFNKPFFFGNESKYMQMALRESKISGDGMFTKKCQKFLEHKYGFRKVLLTTSCSSALEMCALLIDIKSGDEVIIPSFTFVSTANAFVLRGAKIVFADSEEGTPNIKVEEIESLITPQTKAVVCVHYAGIACDLNALLKLCEKHNLFLIEDAAQAIDSFYNGVPIGTFGHLSTFSFHETKNITCGEGGMIVINDSRFITRAETIWAKGTNKNKFLRGEIGEYGWVDIGSSFSPSDILAAVLFAQLENLEKIQTQRIRLWNVYYNLLKPLEDKEFLALPQLPEYSCNTGHIFYIVCRSTEERNKLINILAAQKIQAVFHFNSLHKSEYYFDKHDGRMLHNCEHFSNCLLRLPLYYELDDNDIHRICNFINNYFYLS